MARTRTIKPEFFDDEKLSQISRDARLLFIGTWSCSDDYGVCKGSSQWLKSKIFPYESIEHKTFEKWLAELRGIGALLPFTYAGEQYYLIRTFHRHQAIDRPSKTRNPPAPADLEEKWEAGELASGRLTPQDVRADKSPSREEIPYAEIIQDLNDVLKLQPPRGYSTSPVSKETRELINRRYADGYTIEQFRIVHRNMYAAWHLDAKMRAFLRPQTLYTEKFSSYLNYAVGPSAHGLVSAKGERSIQVAEGWLDEKGGGDAGSESVCAEHGGSMSDL